MVDALTAEFHSGTGEAQVFAVSEHAQVSAVSEEARVSAVSWAAIVAGGVASAALTLLLIAFGAGMSLSPISPWSNSGVSSTAINLGAGIYLVVVAVMASSIGGYLAGRLRTKWVGVHTYEVYFRDTAHGFLAWAFATVLSPAALASAASNIVGGTSAGLSQAAGSAAAQTAGPVAGFVDLLLRADPAATPSTGDVAAPRDELYRLFTSSLSSGGDFAPADRSYMAQVVAANGAESGGCREACIPRDRAGQECHRQRPQGRCAASLLFGAFSASLAAA